MFCLENIILDIFQITEWKQQTENQQLFDGIIGITQFDGVEGLGRLRSYCPNLYTVMSRTPVENLTVN